MPSLHLWSAVGVGRGGVLCQGRWLYHLIQPARFWALGWLDRETIARICATAAQAGTPIQAHSSSRACSRSRHLHSPRRSRLRYRGMEGADIICT